MSVIFHNSDFLCHYYAVLYAAVWVPNSKTKGHTEKPKLAWMFRFQFSAQKIKPQADGRIMCWHWADIFF